MPLFQRPFKLDHIHAKRSSWDGAMAFTAVNPFKFIGRQFKNQYGYQCAAFVQDPSVCNPGPGLTGTWRPGLKVWPPNYGLESLPLDLCFLMGPILPGTIIATFENSRYPDTNQHTGLFLEFVPDGFAMLDQYVSRPRVAINNIVESKGLYFDPRRYYVVENK